MCRVGVIMKTSLVSKFISALRTQRSGKVKNAVNISCV